jgi:hypothetical protein
MLWQQEPHPPFESTYDVGEWYRQSVQGQTVGGKEKESIKNDKSATCATSDTDDNESDWETCSDCSEEISNNKPNCPSTSGHVRRDVTENNHKIPSTSAPSNKVTDGENTASEFPPVNQSEQRKPERYKDGVSNEHLDQLGITLEPMKRRIPLAKTRNKSRINKDTGKL